MHRVNPKKKQAAALRFIAYAVTLTLTVLTTVVLLYIALGYRFDSQNGNVVRSGLLLVDNQPEAASIYINNELKDNTAPGRFVLSAGNYDLSLKKDGYRDWGKNVSLKASGVREVNYPILIPQKLTTAQVAQFTSASMVSQSQDRKFLLTHNTNATNLTLIELDPEEPKQTQITLSTAFSKESSQTGTIRVIEWALNNKQVLLEHTLPSGRVELISIDVTNPENVVNISRVYNGEVLRDIHYVGGNTKEVYGLANGILKRYKLENTESSVILKDIINYQPYSDDTVLFNRTSLTQKSEIGIWQDKVTTIIERDLDPASSPVFKYAKYDDHFYFAIAFTGSNGMTIYKDPLKKPILAKQLPLVKVTFEKPTSLTFSDSSQFVMIQSGSNFKVYDLEDLMQYQSQLPFTLAAGSTLTWIDSHHIQATAENGTSHLLEYDGQNQQALVSTKTGTKIYFSNNYENMYSFLDSEGSLRLNSTRLVNQ